MRPNALIWHIFFHFSCKPCMPKFKSKWRYYAFLVPYFDYNILLHSLKWGLSVVAVISRGWGHAPIMKGFYGLSSSKSRWWRALTVSFYQREGWHIHVENFWKGPGTKNWQLPWFSVYKSMGQWWVARYTWYLVKVFARYELTTHKKLTSRPFMGDFNLPYHGREDCLLAGLKVSLPLPTEAFSSLIYGRQLLSP